MVSSADFDKVLNDNQGLLWSVYRRYECCSDLFPTLDADDIFQICLIAFWTAWVTWDEKRAKFSTHCTNRMQFAVRKELYNLRKRKNVEIHTNVEGITGLVDTLLSIDDEDPKLLAIKNEEIELLMKYYSGLSKHHKLIIKERWLKNKPTVYHKIAKKIGYTKERARQLHLVSFQQLAELMGVA